MIRMINQCICNKHLRESSSSTKNPRWSKYLAVIIKKTMGTAQNRKLNCKNMMTIQIVESIILCLQILVKLPISTKYYPKTPIKPQELHHQLKTPHKNQNNNPKHQEPLKLPKEIPKIQSQTMTPPCSNQHQPNHSPILLQLH